MLGELRTAMGSGAVGSGFSVNETRCILNSRNTHKVKFDTNQLVKSFIGMQAPLTCISSQSSCLSLLDSIFIDLYRAQAP